MVQLSGLGDELRAGNDGNLRVHAAGGSDDSFHCVHVRDGDNDGFSGSNLRKLKHSLTACISVDDIFSAGTLAGNRFGVQLQDDIGNLHPL